MMSALAWVIIGLCYAGALAVASRERARAGGAMLLIWVLILAAFGITLFSEPEPFFQSGSQFGWGLLLGTGLWLIGRYFASQSNTLSPLGALCPLAAPALVLALSPGDPFPALWGVLISIAICWSLLKEDWQETLPLAVSAGALCAAMGLAYHTALPADVSKIMWRWGAPAFALSGWLAYALLQWSSKSAEGYAWRLAHPVTLGLLTAGALYLQMFAGVSFALWLALIWVAGATLIAGFSAGQGALHPRVSLLVAVGVYAGVFALGMGYGLALASLAMGLYALAMVRSSAQDHVKEAYAAGATLLMLASLFRLYTVTYPLRAPRADLYTHYVLLSFIGALVVLAILAQWLRSESDKKPRLYPTLTAGFWSAVAPVALSAIFGVRAGAGWLGGALAATVTAYLFSGSSSMWRLLAPLAFCGFAAAIPFTSLVEAYADLPRLTRAYWMGGLAVVLITQLILHNAFAKKTISDS